MRYAFLLMLVPSIAFAQDQPPVQGFFCASMAGSHLVPGPASDGRAGRTTMDDRARRLCLKMRSVSASRIRRWAKCTKDRRCENRGTLRKLSGKIRASVNSALNSGGPRHVCYSPHRDRTADIAGCPKSVRVRGLLSAVYLDVRVDDNGRHRSIQRGCKAGPTWTEHQISPRHRFSFFSSRCGQRHECYQKHTETCRHATTNSYAQQRAQISNLQNESVHWALHLIVSARIMDALLAN